MSFGNQQLALDRKLPGDHDRLADLFEAILLRAGDAGFESVAAAWTDFREELLCHLEAEEGHLIPALAVDRPGEAYALYEEDAVMRVQFLRLAFDFDHRGFRPGRIDAFTRTLRSHAARVDRILRRLADRAEGATRGRGPLLRHSAPAGSG
jgi:hypothetical protein